MPTPGETTAPVDASAPPDWSSVSGDVFCPLCEYNLRGLVEPRCPECGYQFIWQEIFEAEKLHPFLFEHHPEKNLKSLIRTYLASLWPARFWTKLLPTHVLVARRLILYWLILTIPTIVAIGGAGAWLYFQERAATLSSRASEIALINRSSQAVSRQQVIARFGSIQNWVELAFPMPSILGMLQKNWLMVRLLIPIVCAILAWPWMTLATLLIFRQSMARARIKSAHVMRCVVYSAGVVWPLAPAAIAMVCLVPTGFSSQMWFLDWPLSSNVLLLIGWLFMMASLTHAYRRYLRFPHSLATLLASQAIVGLAMLYIYLTYLGY